MTGQVLRVLHCPEVVGGHAPELARAERALGIEARCVAFHASAYAYAADETLAVPGDRFVALEKKRLKLLWRALREFDVIHFNFGSSIFSSPGDIVFRTDRGRGVRQLILRTYKSALWLRDVALLKRAGKPIFVTYQGDDARQGDYCRRHFPIHFIHEVADDYYAPGSDDEKRRAIARFAVYADGIYSLNPDLLHVLPEKAEFLPYANVDLQQWRSSARTVTSGGPIKIVHAPSHRLVKGTKFLIEAVDRLKAAGLPVELSLVENVTRQAARELYERADIAVDQLLAGWYGGFAVEAMALGKPVVSYLRREDLKFIPAEMREELPLIDATPHSVFDVLKEWLTVRRHELPQAGVRGRRFVERWHDPLTIARNTRAAYERALRQKRSSGRSGAARSSAL